MTGWAFTQKLPTIGGIASLLTPLPRAGRSDLTMGLYMIFLFFAYLVCVQLLGLIVLRFVPQFRVTISNLALFVVGGTAGMFGLFGLVNLRALDVYSYISVRRKGELTLALAFLGALVGGSLLVWMRVALLSKRREH
jgi:hypothetical protein